MPQRPHGRLVLSEFAGAATELRGAFMVNPHDLDGIKEAIRLAMNAGPKETRDRMARMRRKIYRRDVYDWAQAFLAALAADRRTSAIRLIDSEIDVGLELVDEVCDGVDDARRLVGIALDVSRWVNAREHEDRLETGLDAREDVGVHAVADHDRASWSARRGCRARRGS